MSAAGPGEKWAVILGASSGTGAAIARAAAREAGLSVFGAHRGNHPASATSVAHDVELAGRRCVLRLGDAGTAEAAEAGAEALSELAGPRSVKLFVHSLANASVGRLVPAAGEALAPRHFQKTFDSMAHSFVWWTQALVARDLLAPGASLLGLSNPMVDTVVGGTALIAASKAALEMYVRHLAQELGPRGHRVNLLKFGAVNTAAIRRTFGGTFDRLQAVLSRAIPAGRMLDADEVARVVAWLQSDAAAFFNGATIDLTGGETQHLMEVLLRDAPPSQEE